jgi:hypothetical protein
MTGYAQLTITHRDHGKWARAENLPGDGHEASAMAITNSDQVHW